MMAASIASPPTIELQDVSKWYGEVMGVNEVSITFESGVAGLLGPNGAGKSTLLKMIGGMLTADLGSVRIAGHPVFNRPAVMARVGFCPEQDAGYPGISALDVVAYMTRLQGFTRRDARRRARRALEFVGLGNDLDRSVSTYSKGMRQRAKLAQAIAHEPDVIILDEPLNGLDPNGRRELRTVIRALGDLGACVLVSSHILHEVESLCDRIVVLYHGRVLADGTPRTIREELSDYPLTIRVDTDEPDRLAGTLAALDGVQRIERKTKRLIIRTRHPQVLFDAVVQASANGFPVGGVEPIDEDLESVFRYLTQGGRFG